METSLILYLKPELVLPKVDWGRGAEKKNKIKALKEGWAWSERKWSAVSEDTGTGDPALASAAKGEKYFRAVTEKTADFMYDLSKTDVNDLYE
jgi:creatinine amidohydrolase